MDGKTEKRPGPALDAVVYLSGHVHGAGGVTACCVRRLHGKRHVNGRQGEFYLAQEVMEKIKYKREDAAVHGCPGGSRGTGRTRYFT